MISKLRFTLVGMLALAALLLGACTIGQAPEPTPTALDVNAIYTSAAETARAQMTQLASLATATLPPTATLEPTATQAESILPQVTITLEIVPLQSPDPLLVGTATSLPGLTLPLPSSTPLASSGGANTGPVCNNYAFEGDITVPDYTKFKPWEKFEKVWALRNTGTCTWDEGYSFRNFAGVRLAGDDYYITQKSQFVEPGAAVNMGIRMYAPGDPGEYIGHWTMFNDQNQAFGLGVTVVIVVVK
jgi:hypothetical protein